MRLNMRYVIFVLLFVLLCNYSRGQVIDDCSLCGEELLTKEHIDGLSLEKLALLRNEIFARNGYKFNNGLLAYYFNRYRWYVPFSDNKDVELSKTEEINVNFLRAAEKNLQKLRDTSLYDLKRLKEAFNNDNKSVINEYFKEKHYDDLEGRLLDDLKETLNKLDIDAIHWNNGRGLYKVTVDNGYNISGNQIYITGDTIMIEKGDYSHSEIFGDFYDGFSDYESINEYSIMWLFKMTSKGIKIKRIRVAG